MNFRMRYIIAIGVIVSVLVHCSAQQVGHSEWLRRSMELSDSVWKHYREGNTILLRENMGSPTDFKADYLAEARNGRTHAFLWPYSSALSAQVAAYKVKPTRKKLKFIKEIVTRGLDLYLDSARQPAGYASYTKFSPAPDRFYDDNIWIGIDFTDLFIASGDKEFLKRAEKVW